MEGQLVLADHPIHDGAERRTIVAMGRGKKSDRLGAEFFGHLPLRPHPVGQAGQDLL